MLRRVRCHPFPNFPAPMQPSDSLRPSALALVPLARAYCERKRLFFLPGLTGACSRGPLGASSQGPLVPLLSHRDGRASQVSGPSSRCAPHSYTPPDAPLPRPSLESHAAAFGPDNAVGIRIVFFVADTCGSLARAPTHRPGDLAPRRKAHFQPAGLSFGWAGLPPARWLTEFHGVLRLLLSLRTSLAWSHYRK